MKETLYYKKFEGRTPYTPQNFSLSRLIMFQFFAVLFVCIGISYIYWRWTSSLNMDALWFAVPLAIAETLMFVGSVLMVINYWNVKTLPIESPIRYLSEINHSGISLGNDRPLKIDVFIATLNEDKEVVEDTIRDAKKLIRTVVTPKSTDLHLSIPEAYHTFCE